VLIARARTDIEAGRLWKARSRLEGGLRERPTDEELLRLLGEVCYSMGDLPAAGRYWFLTTRAGKDVDEAFAAMHEAHHGPGPLLTVLPVLARADEYPPQVADRLHDVVAKTSDQWFLRKKRMLLSGRDQRSFPSPLDGDPVGAVILAVIVGVWVLGAITLVYLFLRLLALVF